MQRKIYYNDFEKLSEYVREAAKKGQTMSKISLDPRKQLRKKNRSPKAKLLFVRRSGIDYTRNIVYISPWQSPNPPTPNPPSATNQPPIICQVN